MKNKEHSHTVTKCVDWPYTKNFTLFRIFFNLIYKILVFWICFLLHIPKVNRPHFSFVILVFVVAVTCVDRSCTVLIQFLFSDWSFFISSHGWGGEKLKHVFYIIHVTSSIKFGRSRRSRSMQMHLNRIFLQHQLEESDFISNI